MFTDIDVSSSDDDDIYLQFLKKKYTLCKERRLIQLHICRTYVTLGFMLNKIIS